MIFCINLRTRKHNINRCHAQTYMFSRKLGWLSILHLFEIHLRLVDFKVC